MGSRCKKFRECNLCSRIRQKQIADVAEKGAESDKSITFAVIRAFDQYKIAENKARFIQQLKSKVNGGIWTIENAEYAGLHLNLIVGTDKAITATTLAKAWGFRGGDTDIYSEQIDYNDIRNVAAYCAKIEQTPSKDEYPGHVYGSFGTWKRPLGFLMRKNVNPRIQLVALEQMLKNAGVGGEEYEKRGGLPRVLDIIEHKLNTDGFYVLENYGIITKDDLEKYINKPVSTTTPTTEEDKPVPAPEWVKDWLKGIK